MMCWAGQCRQPLELKDTFAIEWTARRIFFETNTKRYDIIFIDGMQPVPGVTAGAHERVRFCAACMMTRVMLSMGAWRLRGQGTILRTK